METRAQPYWWWIKGPCLEDIDPSPRPRRKLRGGHVWDWGQITGAPSNIRAHFPSWWEGEEPNQKFQKTKEQEKNSFLFFLFVSLLLADFFLLHLAFVSEPVFGHEKNRIKTSKKHPPPKKKKKKGQWNWGWGLFVLRPEDLTQISTSGYCYSPYILHHGAGYTRLYITGNGVVGSNLPGGIPVCLFFFFFLLLRCI